MLQLHNFFNFFMFNKTYIKSNKPFLCVYIFKSVIFVKVCDLKFHNQYQSSRWRLPKSVKSSILSSTLIYSYVKTVKWICNSRHCWCYHGKFKKKLSNVVKLTLTEQVSNTYQWIILCKQGIYLLLSFLVYLYQLWYGMVWLKLIILSGIYMYMYRSRFLNEISYNTFFFTLH